MDGVTRLSRTSAAVAETETRQSRTPRIPSQLTSEINMGLDVGMKMSKVQEEKLIFVFENEIPLD